MDHADAGLPEGHARQALSLAMRTLDMAEQRRRPADMSTALALVARSLKALGAYPAADDYLVQALRWATMLPGIDARVDLVCELAEVACATAESAQAVGDDAGVIRGARERARDHAFEAAALAGQTSDAQWEVKVLLRISDVLDRCGDHDDAATMQNRAISLMGLNTDLAAAAGTPDNGPELPLAPGSTLLM